MTDSNENIFDPPELQENTFDPSENKPMKGGTRLIPRLWGRAEAIAISILFFILYIGGQTAVVLFMGVDGAISFEAVATLLIASFIAAFASVGIVNLIRTKHSWAHIGITFSMPREWVWPSVWLGLGAGVVRMGIIVGLFYLFPSLEEGAEALNEMFVMDQLWQSLAVGALATFLVPVYEELFFRGFIHNALRNRFGMWTTIIIGSIIFGVFHVIPAQIITAFLLGLVLGWLYEKSGSLTAVILCHAVNNGLAMVLTLISTQISFG